VWSALLCARDEECHTFGWCGANFSTYFRGNIRQNIGILNVPFFFLNLNSDTFSQNMLS
jgi:hypothetical protein